MGFRSLVNGGEVPRGGILTTRIDVGSSKLEARISIWENNIRVSSFE